MSTTNNETIIPRPGAITRGPISSIPGPSEELFTSTFGSLLPAAQYLSSPYGTIAYYTYSPTTSASSQASKVLFLHGVQTPSLGLQPLASSLRSKFPSSEFVLVDLWGHGLSSTPLIPHTPSLFHNLIDSLLDHLDWKSCSLVAYSFGGSTAISYISSSPDRRATRISSVALIAPAGLWKPDSEKLENPEYTVAANHVMELLEGGLLVVPEDWRIRVKKGEIVAEAVRAWQMEHHAGHFASVVAIVRDGGVFGKQKEFVEAVGTGIPIFAVLGESDDVVYEKDLRDSGVEDVVVVKGVGHAVVRQRADEVAGHIEGFWKRLQERGWQRKGLLN